MYVVAPPETFEEALETVAPLPAGVTFLRRPGADVDFATVQAIGLAAGLVDHKSGSMTDGYQGLQFVYRLKDRAG